MAPLGDCMITNNGMFLISNDSSTSSLSSTLTRLRLDKSPKVSFCETVTVRSTLNIEDFTPEEYQSYWINSDEFRIRTRYADIAAELFDFFGKTHDDGDVHYRGLENRTVTAIEHYTDKYFAVILAVLDEQDLQRSLGFTDDERIAMACRPRTYLCEQEALLRAMEDELATKDIH